LARLLSQFAINQLPDAIDCHFLEHGFDLSGLNFIANPEGESEDDVPDALGLLGNAGSGRIFH
jgi:hypothetical protein